MKFTQSWLARHSKIKSTSNHISEVLTNIGLEVESITKPNKNLNLFQSAVGLKDNTQKLFRYRKFDENDPYSTQGSSLLDYRSGTNKPFVEIKVIDFINHINKQKKEISLLIALSKFLISLINIFL